MANILKQTFPLLLILLQVIGGESANIFIYMGVMTSHSPTASIQPLADKLAERGHKVTLFSPIEIPERHPDVHLFCPPELRQLYQNFIIKFGTRSTQQKLQKGFGSISLSQIAFDSFDESHHICEGVINNPSVQELIEKERFDLFIVDNGLNDCGFPLAYLFKAKVIIYSAIGTLPWDGLHFGVPTELSWLPGLGTAHAQIVHTSLEGKGGEIPFKERLINTLMVAGMNWLYREYQLPRIETLYRENGNMEERVKGMPRMGKLIENVSLVLMNQHYSDQYPRPYPPFVVQVGGMHATGPPNGTLPQNIESFIGDNEFIYVSFGTYIRVSSMPQELIQVFFDVFQSAKFKFLWKWEGQLPLNPPSNILFQPWFPQLNVLAHKKIRGFLTQGGHISVTQSACRGVPMIICPVDADQPLNAVRMMETGNAIVLDLLGLTRSQLSHALTQLVTNPSFVLNARKISVACKDRAMSPLDTAIWWTEWVLRTEDSRLLKPGSIGQSLWLTWNLDIWAFLFAISCTLTLLLLFITKLTFSKLFFMAFSRRSESKIKIS